MFFHVEMRQTALRRKEHLLQILCVLGEGQILKAHFYMHDCTYGEPGYRLLNGNTAESGVRTDHPYGQ